MQRKFIRIFEEFDFDDHDRNFSTNSEQSTSDYRMIKDEMADLADRITDYVSYLEKDPTAIDLHRAEDILTNTLIDVMSLNDYDPKLTKSKEFDRIRKNSQTLANMITGVSPGRQEATDRILAKYEDLRRVNLN